jgi:hypothetical protein
MNMTLTAIKDDTAGPMSEQEEAIARLIGVLLCTAKWMQMTKRALDAGEESGGRSASDLIMSAVRLYRGDGNQLEKDALMLGELLGFAVEEIYSVPGSGVIQ